MSENKVAVQDVWTVHTTVDEFGRTGDFIGVFSTEEKAAVAAADKGWYGGPGRIKQRKALAVPGVKGVYLLSELRGSSEHELTYLLDLNYPEHQKRLQESALAKLTTEEKAALGLK